MNNAEITKPPLAPKPKIIGHLSPVAVSKFSPSLPRADTLHNLSSMSRGPKPPIAPKPKFSADSEGKSSVYTNNNLNKCSNGKLVCLDGELYEGNQCNADCPESEADNEYIVVPETQLTSKDCNDLEHEHDLNLDSSEENEVLETPEEVGREKDNIANDEDTSNRDVTEDEHCNSSDIAEPMEPDSEESTRDCDQSEALCEESSDAPDGDKDAFKNVDEDEDVVSDCSETKNKEATPNNLELFTDNSDCKTDSDNILSRDEELKGDICKDTILMPLPEDESIPGCEKAGQEELPAILEKGDECLAHDGDHGVHAELDLNMEGELENDDCASPDVLPDEASEEAAPGLEPCENQPSTENGLGESIHQAAAEEEEADTDEHSNTNTGNASDTCQITERRGEEKTPEVACEASEDSGKEEEETVNAENTDAACQIAPCENECGEGVPMEHSDENLQTEGTSLDEEGVISNSLPSSPGMDPELEDTPAEEHSENIVETSKSDELQLEDNELEANSLSKRVPSPPQQVPLEEELEVRKHGKMNAECGTKHILHENLAVPEVVIVPEDSEERETSSDSLDDPYVLPAENEIAHDGQTDLGTDYSKRDGLGMDGENNLLPVDCKSIVTRTRSLSGKMPGYVPETVPEEAGPETDLPSSCNGSGTEVVSNNLLSVEGKPTEANRALPTKSRRFILYPRSYSVEGREIPVSVYRESDGCVLDDGRIKRTEDNLSLPCVNGSSGSFSQRNHLSSCGLSTPSSVVDIPPPFELAYITKKPITKSSPSLLIENDSPDKYSKKKKSSFKRFLTLKFKKKTESKVHVDVNVSSSRSSSESSYHGPPRLMDLDRRSLSSSPQLKSHVGKLRASESPSAVLFYKDGKRKGTPKSFSKSVSRVESFEDRSRPPFMPLPLTKPRSISFPNADTSDYENIPAMSSDYENIQIPPRRSTRAGTFTEFFEDPSRALSAANENDGYVDMSSFTGFENKQQTTDQETESAYTEPYKVCPVSVIPMEVVTSDEEQKSSEDDETSPGDSSLINKKEGQSRAYLIAQELMSSEKVYVEMLQLLHTDFYEGILKVLGEEDENEQEEVKLKQGLRELPEIYELHQDILGELEERVLKWKEQQKVADVFVSRKSRLNHHTAYIMQFDKNLALLDETCLKYSQLATIIQEFEQNSDGSPQSVKHQLLKVVQRVFQYRVLLTDYLNNLCPDSTEYEATQAALFIVSEITDRANDSMLQAENLQKLVHIEHSVRGQSGLLQPGRIFVKEGTLMKVAGKNRHPRHLFLMNDVLLYTYPQKDGKYRLKNTLAVSGMKVSRPVTEKAQNVLKIECDEYCLTLSASSCSERDDWYSCISRHIPDDYKAHTTSTFHSSVELRERLGIPLGERPPTLVPVSHVMMCMNCGCDFTLTLRRHHCHACGKIVCRNCSRNKYPMKYLKDQAAKVCDSCYVELKKRERPLSVSFPPTSSRCSSSAFSSVFHNIHYTSFKKQKKIPSALTEVAASGEGATISGYLSRCKRGKRHWKKRWFVIKGKVLYTYTANEDKVATESLPLLGFTIAPEKEEGSMDTVFHLYHKQTLFYSFRAEDNNSAQRWIEAMEEASIL
ncbi:FYVE, RhoGEF and PH domain-containing protein 5 isoform X1 [Falco rusticolus]|uniref:FYVE, RhoGEF and PH domain-containing protein 5 isoform X1 n=1 Tax=Falco rusticolus TaxID=120794 RepID=UPI0018868F2B|nr:FYVE, RhoGEF and PH domain-containing protein 5 isoform X1 [Falco rusticolus]XP_055562952.1 FYVE, RhoGEF and PH domain-containing protein 5 isoform X1 [Falco cherrug]